MGEIACTSDVQFEMCMPSRHVFAVFLKGFVRLNLLNHVSQHWFKTYHDVTSLTDAARKAFDLSTYSSVEVDAFDIDPTTAFDSLVTRTDAKWRDELKLPPRDVMTHSPQRSLSSSAGHDVPLTTSQQAQKAAYVIAKLSRLANADEVRALAEAVNKFSASVTSRRSTTVVSEGVRIATTSQRSMHRILPGENVLSRVGSGAKAARQSAESDLSDLAKKRTRVNSREPSVNPANLAMNPTNLQMNLTPRPDFCGGCKEEVTYEHSDAVCCDKCNLWWHDACVQVGMLSRAITSVSAFIGSPMPKYGTKWFCASCRVQL